MLPRTDSHPQHHVFAPRSGASNHVRQAGPERPLGNKRQNVGGEAERRAKEKGRRRLLRELAADQRTAASIFTRRTDHMSREDMPSGRGVCLCGWTQQAARRGQKDRDRPRVELHRSEATADAGPRAFYAGLSRCKLRWVCPVCTREKSEESRADLNAALAASRAAGFTPLLVTLTARHHRGMALADFWSRLSTAEKRLKGLTRWKRMNAPDGPMVGFAKAVEATHGAAGWHPHFHLLLVMRSPDEARALAAVAWLKDAWLYQLDRVGLDGTTPAARRRAFDVQGAAQAGSYVTKWGAAEELALSGAKTGRGGGRTPWQLLRDARKGETPRDRAQAADLWFEFVTVFDGVHQLRLSPSLKSLIREYKAQHPAEEPDLPAAELIVQFGDDWAARGRYRRVAMREAVEDASDAQEARWAALDALMGDASDAQLLDQESDDIEDFDLIEIEDDQPGPAPAFAFMAARPPPNKRMTHDPGGT